MFEPQKELKWLYVDFNSFFASVEQQLNPALRGKPVAVVPVDTEATCAIAASYEAKAFGVKTGTMIYEAKKMCPGLICVLADHSHYIEFHEKLIDEVDKHIPVTAVCSIDEMACKLMKNESSVEQACKIAHEIKQGIADNIGKYVRCSIGIAPNKYLSKVATDMQKPDGLTVLMLDNLESKLLNLKLRDLPGIGSNVEARLNRAGVYDMQALLSLQPKHLRSIWGNLWGEKMYYYLRGYDIPDSETSRSTIGHSHVLSPEMRPPDKAWIIAKRLTNKAAARLRRIGYVASLFHISVRTEDGVRFAFDSGCRASQDSFTFLAILEEMWGQLLPEVRNKRIKKISVDLLKLEKPEDVQPDLFDIVNNKNSDKQIDKCNKLSSAIDDLNKKFGKDTVLLGMSANQGKSFSGTKIAFTRIPDMEEFFE